MLNKPLITLLPHDSCRLDLLMKIKIKRIHGWIVFRKEGQIDSVVCYITHLSTCIALGNLSMYMCSNFCLVEN